MLEEIRISGLGVIDDAILEPAPGFTVVTGETGAGKTMVVTGLGLLLGGRADVGAIRPGSRAALIEGRIRVPPDSPALARALEAGGDLDDGALLVSRTIAEGRSRTHVGGRAVPVSVLAELAEDVVAVHGQSEQLRLLRPDRQLSALDRFAGTDVQTVRQRYSQVYVRLRKATDDLRELTAKARERAQEADLLRFGVREIGAVNPQPGELDELRAEESRLAHAEDLRNAATGAHAALVGGPDDSGHSEAPPDAAAAISLARRALETARGHDSALGALAERVAEVGYLVADLASELNAYAGDLGTDPARLESVQARRSALTGLLRKYGDDLDAVLDWAKQADHRLNELEDDGTRIAELRTEQASALAELGELAGRLSSGRSEAAARFSASVQAELSALAMPHAQLEFAVTQATDPAGLPVAGRVLSFGPLGVDNVELLLAAHNGAPLRPIQRGASGGELSRVMLAIEVVFAGADPVPTYVFDEVDAGVGGKAAVEIGRRLARLARTAQVIVVTHLPQVAAFADRHLSVVKSDDGSITTSGIHQLDDEARVRELSRMLAGLEDSSTARAHAQELLAAARSEARDGPAQKTRSRPRSSRRKAATAQAERGRKVRD